MESIPALDALPGVKARLIGRLKHLDVARERAEAMALLAPYHKQLLRNEGLGTLPFVTAEQIHGNRVSLVGENNSLSPETVPGVDGLLTRKRGLTLGIYVADCAPVWVVARNGRAGALLHSGKKGTELGIVAEGIRGLCTLADIKAEDLVVVIGPCIRPPCYEIDFAAVIRGQASQLGVQTIIDGMICTACHPDRYYSYRRERGLTGRMLATLSLLPL